MKKIFLFKKESDGTNRLIGRYDSEADAQKKVMKMHKEVGDSVFDFYIESKNITDRVKSYADACDVLCIKPMNEEDMRAKGFRPDEIARRKLETITEALNEGWKPNWTDTAEFKYYPWFCIEESEGQADGGLSCADTTYAVSLTGTCFGSRLCFHDSETARYAGLTFTDLYEQILIGNIKK